jgi:nucleotide-binding universal stress UspA family protein
MSHYSHVLVAVDFSEFSERAAVRAAEIANLDEASLTLLHVIDYFPEDLPVDLIAPEDVDPAEYLERECRVKLTGLAGRLGHAEATPLVTFSTHSARHEIVHRQRCDPQCQVRRAHHTGGVLSQKGGCPVHSIRVGDCVATHST